ncbi:MAG: glycosyl hydrolase-related protein, partial [Chloroflexota bacterium]|nr:glycosyl hydrolase-related protein [Chloroflexota bacterium]
PLESGLLVNEGLQLATGSVKRAEDGHGLILRLYEPHGARGEAILRFSRPVRSAERTNLLEDVLPQAPLEVEGEVLRVQVRPYEVLTLKVAL